MGFYGVESIFDEVEARLQDKLPAVLAALSVEYGDGLALAAPHESSYLRLFDPADQAELDAISYPAVVLRPEPEEVPEAPAFGDEYAVATPIEVAFMVGYDSALRQQTRLLRYLRAGKEILAPQAALTCGQCRYAGGGFARTWTTDSGVLRDVALLFVVTVFESPS